MALTQISTAGIKNDAVTADKLPVNSVGSSELADNSVDTAAIGDDSVTAAKLAANAVATAAIVDDAVTAAKLALPLDLADNEKIRLGTGNDLEIYHGSDASHIRDTGTGHINIWSNEVRMIDSGGTEYMFRAFENGAVELYHNNSKKLETTSIGTQITGRLNIGTSTEGHAAADDLTIENTAADMGMTLRSGTGNQGAIYFSDGTSGDAEYRGIVLYNHANDAFSIYSSATERMRIESDGDVVVKTDNVALRGSGTLRINSGSTSGALNLDGGQSNHGGEINLFGGSNGGRILFRTGQGSGQQGEKMRLDENGRLLLGTTDVGYPAYADNLTVADTGGHCGITIRSATNSQGNIYFSDGTGTGTDTYKGMITYQHNGDYFTISANHTGGDIRVDDDGIKFGSDTAAANGLHDYEEGTWTPDLTRWTGSAWWSNTWDTAPTTNIGLYRKIGNVVYVTFDIAGFDVGSATDGRYVGMNGLPFACTSNNGNAGHLIVTYSASVFETNDATSFWVSNGGTTTTTVIFGDDNGSHNTYSSGSGKRIRGQGFYFTS